MHRAAIMTILVVAVLGSAAHAQQTPVPYQSATRYDTMGRKTGVIAPDPDGAGPLRYAAVRYTYDSGGNITKVEHGELGNWKPEQIAPSDWGSDFAIRSTKTFTLDTFGRKTVATVSDSAGVRKVTQISFDSMGRTDCVAIRMNVTASLPSSACDQALVGSHGPDRITRNIYDAAGRVVQIREGVGTPIEDTKVTYSFTPNGKPEFLIDPNGNRAKLVYDSYDRQSHWYLPSPQRPTAFNDSTQANALSTAGTFNAADYEAYGYDANGNRISFRKRDGSVITFQYDGLNRVTFKGVPERASLPADRSRDVYYGYDLRGLMTYARFDGHEGPGITTVYDGFGGQQSSTSNQDGIAREIRHRFDANGNRTALVYPDQQHVTFAYDGLDRMTEVKQSGSALLAKYIYNAQGMLASRTNGAGSVYGYDLIGRPRTLSHDFAGTTADVTWTLDHNPASQVTSNARDNDRYAWTGSYNITRDYQTNGLNQYTSAGTATFTYDANGNLVSDGSTTFLYDIENRLVGASGAKTASLYYDPMGRLFEVSGSTSGNRTRFVYDGDELIAEYDGAGTLMRRHVHGSGADDPIVTYEGAGLASARHVITDVLGSVVGISDSSGNLVSANTYDEFGIPGVGNTGRFQYTGQILLPELGLYHYKARIYSPTLGRFLQTDPIGYDDQINLYAYVGNDPVNNIDPDGMLSCPKKDQCPGATEGANEDQKREMENARREGVRKAWAQERELVRQGGGTRAWTRAERAEILKNGYVKGYHGHHINTVKGNDLALARNPNNIRFLTPAEHRQVHMAAGGYQTPIRGQPLLNRTLAVGGWLNIFTGIVSGRIRTDNLWNFGADLTGIPSPMDEAKQMQKRCQSMGFDAELGDICA